MISIDHADAWSKGCTKNPSITTIDDSLDEIFTVWNTMKKI
jgi:hypothetical protein